ncbi:hypothetical protein Pan44_38110 [Caulifigura coniformis]|uniref:Carboxypeptidase regulatory-like domain-containing protein n=1 Tax=Caulifigura coniformis TaxID=2527983 RepID=A0A517SI14_9PLAN|nr:hypothetical protein [Caulifigura coniformis]QDT55763.1 hypothetical protein Pan44_38110 [Caulifigura coniformis]
MRPLYVFALLLLLIVVVVYWPRKQQFGAPKVPVSGRVLVNGRPGEYMVVRFRSDNAQLGGQDRQPVAGANADGSFEMSSFGGMDGAAPGEYVVTFYWPTNPLTMGRDRLRGRFTDPEKSEYRVTISEEATVLPDLELRMPEAQILPLEFDPVKMGSEALRSALESAPTTSNSPKAPR